MAVQESQDESGSGFAAITSQADLDRIIGERITRERAKYADYDALKADSAELAKVRDAEKTEQQRLADAMAAAQSRAEQAEAALARMEVIAKHAIPAEHHDLVHGTTVDELEASAAKVAGLLAAKESAPTGKPGPYVAGEGKTPPALNDDRLAQGLARAVGANL